MMLCDGSREGLNGLASLPLAQAEQGRDSTEGETARGAAPPRGWLCARARGAAPGAEPAGACLPGCCFCPCARDTKSRPAANGAHNPNQLIVIAPVDHFQTLSTTQQVRRRPGGRVCAGDDGGTDGGSFWILSGARATGARQRAHATAPRSARPRNAKLGLTAALWAEVQGPRARGLRAVGRRNPCERASSPLPPALNNACPAPALSHTPPLLALLAHTHTAL